MTTDTIFIYVIASDPAGPCKIGYASKPERRLRQLQTGHPERLELFHTQPFERPRAKLIERILHKTLKFRREQGEWFAIDVKTAIAEIDFVLIRYGEEVNLHNYL